MSKVGAVLVVGAGIGGIQSALDLADSGFKVYLLEKNPSIGGVMAQLDKTFPTNDCSMCILAPKLVTAGRHPNIELITYSDLESVEGQEGKFRIKVNKRARSVDESKCTGCGTCTEKCPVIFEPQLLEDDSEPKVRDKEEINAIIAKYIDMDGPLTQILLEVNNKYRYVPRDVIEYLAYKMEIPMSAIYRVATFYKAFSLELRGKYHIKICLGTACHVRGARNLMDKVRTVTSDAEQGMFSLEPVNCLGACAMGPIVVVNDDYHGQMNNKKVEDLFAKIMDGSYVEEEGEA
jgi:heterodisulfide reductase subunit A